VLRTDGSGPHRLGVQLVKAGPHIIRLVGAPAPLASGDHDTRGSHAGQPGHAQHLPQPQRSLPRSSNTVILLDIARHWDGSGPVAG